MVLKKQIGKIEINACPTYEKDYILNPVASYHYLNQLDVTISRYLKDEYNLQSDDLRYAAYLLVTYAIEVRADELCPQYQAVLKAHKSTVSVHNIIAEEKNHLAEMEKQLQVFSPSWETLCGQVCSFESKLHQGWIDGLKASF